MLATLFLIAPSSTSSSARQSFHVGLPSPREEHSARPDKNPLPARNSTNADSKLGDKAEVLKASRSSGQGPEIDASARRLLLERWRALNDLEEYERVRADEKAKIVEERAEEHLEGFRELKLAEARDESESHVT